MKKTFSFNKKQEACLDRLNKTLKACRKAGVSLLFDADNYEVYAFAMSRHQQENLEVSGYCTELAEGCVDVTEKLGTRATECDGYFIDKDTRFGLRKISKKIMP